jgi:hypothetical protein
MFLNDSVAHGISIHKQQSLQICKIALSSHLPNPIFLSCLIHKNREREAKTGTRSGTRWYKICEREAKTGTRYGTRWYKICERETKAGTRISSMPVQMTCMHLYHIGGLFECQSIVLHRHRHSSHWPNLRFRQKSRINSKIFLRSN